MSRRRFWCSAAAFAFLAVALALGCAKEKGVAPPPGPAWFEDVTEAVGLDFVHDAGPVDDRYFMPQSIGSGAALFDFNGDGRLDIYLLNNGGPKGRPNQLFEQTPDGTFRNVSKGSGLDFSGHCMGVAVGDVNNDGLPDVLVTEYQGVRLFLNNGDGTFSDITKEAGISNPLWGTSAAFVDYDRDGWLDLVVTNNVSYDPTRRCSRKDGKLDYCPPESFSGTVTKLFRNLGRTGAKGQVRFEDRTTPSGLGLAPGPGLGVVCADFDGDGWPDLFVANDGKPNHLWINQKDGTFKEEGMVRGLAYNALGQNQGNMGIALADINGDGLQDIFITHLTEQTHTLWVQGPRGHYRDRTVASGVAAARRGTGWGTVLADFDHDGKTDLALVNGRVLRGAALDEARLGPFWSRYAERNQLFAGDGEGGFREISASDVPFCGDAGSFRGLAVGDIDRDGALDLLVTAIAGPARLFRNVAPKRGHWLMVRATTGTGAGRDAYGAEVVVTAGGRRRSCLVNPGQSYLCSHAPEAHFGLGAADTFERIEVLWPDGSREAFPGGKADRSLGVRQGKGTKVTKSPDREPGERGGER